MFINKSLLTNSCQNLLTNCNYFAIMKTTADIEIPKKVIDRVIGQEHAVNVIKKAAQQKRHVLLIGEPGTGKSLLGVALADLLPKEHLIDVLALPNPNDIHYPLIKTVPAGKGRNIVEKAGAQHSEIKTTVFLFIVAVSAT